MIILDQQERTLSGKFTRKPHVIYEPDDFPPDSKYWRQSAVMNGLMFTDLVGADNAHLWCEMKWPGNNIDGFTFKQIAQEFRNAYNLGCDVVLDMLECTCKPDTAVACPPCRAAARIRARSADVTIE